MNKKDFSELHRLLAILKYDLIVDKLYNSKTEKEKSKLQNVINSITTIMEYGVVSIDEESK